MIFLGYFLIYIVRYNLSVHIVDMAQILKRDEILLVNDTKITRSRIIDNDNTRQGVGGLHHNLHTASEFWLFGLLSTRIKGELYRS